MVLLQNIQSLLVQQVRATRNSGFRTDVSKAERMILMTQNQISFYRARNEALNNAALRSLEQSKLDETKRANLASEKELNRSHLASEAETFRSNQARELENWRSNTAKEQETQRANRATEELKRQQNVITLTTAENQLREQTRHNKVGEYLQGQSQAEIARHNVAAEQELYTHNRATEANDRIQAQTQQFRAATDRAIGAYNARTNRINAVTNQYNAETNAYNAEINKAGVLVQAKNADTQRAAMNNNWALQQSQMYKNFIDAAYSQSKIRTDVANSSAGILNAFKGMFKFGGE